MGPALRSVHVLDTFLASVAFKHLSSPITELNYSCVYQLFTSLLLVPWEGWLKSGVHKANYPACVSMTNLSFFFWGGCRFPAFPVIRGVGAGPGARPLGKHLFP